MAETAQTAPQSRTSGLLRSLLKKALAPLVSSLVHAASVYLGQKAGELAQEKLVPFLNERRGGGEPAEKKSTQNEGSTESGEFSREDQRRDREQRRNKRRKALEQTGST